jgi:peptide/nickel transport system substrate-binding protein
MGRLRFSSWFIAVLVIVIPACGNSASTNTATSSTIIHGTTIVPTSLDPAGSWTEGSVELLTQVQEGLMGFAPGSLVPKPQLATSCAWLDSLDYKCTLRSGVKFQNGSTLTSQDVLFSFKRLIQINDPDGGCFILGPLANCGKWTGKEITTPDANTVIFHFLQPYSLFPDVLTTSPTYIVPSNGYPADKLQESPVIGTGHYKLTQYLANNQAVLKVYSGYWGSAATNSTVVVRYFDRSSTLRLAVQQGEVDIAWGTLTATDLRALSNAKGVKIIQRPGTVIRFFAFNLKYIPQLAIRQAVAYTIDRQSIAKNVYDGYVAPLYSLVPVGVPGHIDAFANMYGTTPDTTKAAQLLQSAGIKTPVHLDIWWTPTHYGDSSADEYTEIKRQLDASGLFQVTLNSTEYQQYSKSAVHDQYPVYELGLTPDYPDGDDFMAQYYLCTAYEHDHYCNSQFDQLVAQEEDPANVAQRDAIFAQLQQIAARDVPIVPIWQGGQVAVERTGLVGVEGTLDGSNTLRYWVISKPS